MNIFKYTPIFLCFLCTACKLFSPGSGLIKNDKLISAYSKEIEKLDMDEESISKEQALIKKYLDKLEVDPKYMAIVRNQVYINSKYLKQIDQRRDYIKLRLLTRTKFIKENAKKLTSDVLVKDYEAYKKNIDHDKNTYPWRNDPIRINTTIFKGQ